jgi:LPXTG-motif cell wall-anchored protein
MLKKWVSGIFATTLVFAVPALAFACNWGAEVRGDCQSLQLSVHVEHGDSEKAGQYELFWSKDGNAKEGQKIATGEIPSLKKGEVHNFTYDVTKNMNGQEGHYIFHLIEPKGSIWSKEINVKDCKPTIPTPPPATDNGGTQPPMDDNGGTTPPPTSDNGGTTTPPTVPADNGSKPAPTPVVTQPAHGGKMPKTASSMPTMIALGAVLLAGGALTLRAQKQN